MGKKRKVLFVVPSLRVGGAERVVVNVANSLVARGYVLRLVLFEDIMDYRGYLGPDVIVECLGKKSSLDFLRMVVRLREVYRRFQPDFVVSYLEYTNIVSSLSSLFMGRRFKLILSERNHFPSHLREVRFGRLKRLLMKVTYGKADAVIVNSRGVKRALEEEFGLDPGRLLVVPNPVDLKVIAERSKEPVDHPFFHGGRFRVIVGAGRLFRQKRFDRLLAAFQLVVEKRDDVRLIILGEGELIGELENLSSRLGLSGKADFVGVKLNPYAWISRADVFVLSSDHEGFPNVLLEAMACGTPVVSTDCPTGPSELITSGLNGLITGQSTPESLAEAVLRVLNDGKLSALFSAEGRKRVEDFGIERVAGLYEELLK